MSITRCFYKNRIALNVLANSIENAKNVYMAAEGHVLIGLLSKNYSTIKQAVESMKAYGAEIGECVSIGLGGGDSRQSTVVADIVKHYPGCHINQTFPAVGETRAKLEKKEGWINALVSPSGKVGYVNISTGPISIEQKQQALIPIQAAIGLIRDMGGNAIKYFPMKGLAHEDEFREVARVCGEENFALEPTGGINKENIEQILRIALESNVPEIIPHVYSSVIDSETGETNIVDVKEIYELIKKLVDKYE